MRLNLGCGIYWSRGFINTWIHDERGDERWYDSYETGAENMEVDLLKPWPWEDNSVDVIIESHWLSVCPKRLYVMKEAYRVLKPGGWFRMADSPERFWVEGLQRREAIEPWLELMPRKEFVEELVKMGFKNIHEVNPDTTDIPETPEIKAEIIHNHGHHRSFVLECQK